MRPSFLSYDPVELAFGTSGMRGLVADMTDLEVYVCTKGALAYLRRVGDVKAGDTVLLGGDLRPSTERISKAALQAILDGGYGVEYAGLLPTPALMLRGLATRRAGVMVTGSHIPFDRNGIKISRTDGELRKSDERGVLEEIARVRKEEYGKDAATSAFDDKGLLKRAPSLPAIEPSARRAYVARYVDAFPEGLRGVRLAFYQHSAVGRELVPEILRALGAEVIALGRSETFVPVDTEAVDDAQLARLRALAEEAGWQIDAIVSTDGDSDRPLVAAVRSDRRVQFVPGDLLGLLAASWLDADAAAVPVSANDAVDLQLGKRGVTLHKTKIGSPYVIEGLEALHAGGARRVVGWEANGGFLLHSALTGERPLAPLPTRDAVLPMVAVLGAAREAGVGVHELVDALPPRFGRSGLIDLPVETSRAILAGLATNADIERAFPGYGKVVRTETIDGLRIYFDSGEVAHLRASGNAPQLRIYAVAPTQARADEIVAHVLAPDGVLRTLARGS